MSDDHNWLDELRALEQKATPGPWVAKLPGPDEHYLSEGRCGGISSAARIHEYQSEIVTTDSGVYGPSADDARLIVACRNALPRLLARLEALERVAAAGRESLETGRRANLHGALVSLDAAEAEAEAGKERGGG